MSLLVLQCTSALFGSVVLHAYLKREPVLHFLSLGVSVMGVWNHSVQNAGVRTLDAAFAHLLFFYAVVGLALAENWLVILVLGVGLLWVSEHCWFGRKYAVKLHAALHLTSQLGLHWYLMLLSP